MPFQSTTHPLPMVEINEITDPVVANIKEEFIDQDVVQLQSKPLKARQVLVRLDGSVVMYYCTNQRVRTRPKLLPGFIGYLTFGPTATGTVNGLQVRHDVMLAFPPGANIGMVADAGYESMAFLLRSEDVQGHLGVRGRGQEYRLPQNLDLLRVGTNVAGHLFDWGKRLIDMAEAEPALFNDHPERRAAARADLLDTLFSTLSLTSALEPERRERTRQGQSDIVREAEGYAMAHAEDRLYVTDLCRAARVSERTLEYAFRAVMGLSPKGYLTKLRLHKVHHALLMASPQSTSVTAEALNWGFWHFGEFSKVYKECFDELPSDTLRRSPQPAGGKA